MTASLPDFKHGVFFLSWRSRIACPLPRQRYRVAKQNVCPCFEHLRESDVGRIRLVLGPAAPQPPRSDVLCSESSSGERAPPASKSGGSRIGALASCAAAGLGGPQAAQPRVRPLLRTACGREVASSGIRENQRKWLCVQEAGLAPWGCALCGPQQALCSHLQIVISLPVSLARVLPFLKGVAFCTPRPI